MKRCLLTLFLIALIGCAAVKVNSEGTKIDKSQVLNIKPGTTTRQTVIETFGAPTNITYENNEEKMVYIYKEKKTPYYINGLVESEAQSKESTTTLELRLRDGIVYSYNFKSSEN